MISTPFEYSRATSLDDALAKLRGSNGEGKFIAGGHSLVPLMKLRLSEPAVLIDIARIPGLSGIREKDGTIEIGAGDGASRRRHVGAAAASVCPVLAETAAAIGDPQVRNRGTLGGSLAHADPSADYPAAMLALDAEIQLKGAEGLARGEGRATSSRACSPSIWRADEIIVAVQFTPVKSAAYAKLHQRASHFAIVGVAAALEVKGGTIQSARIGLTGASSHATRLTDGRGGAHRPTASSNSIETAAQAAGAESRGHQLRHSCQRRVPARDDSGVHRAAR